MTINFKQPKYILPLLALPFFCLFFYAFRSTVANTKQPTKPQTGINGTVAGVSADIKKRRLSDKLNAYRNTYKDANGMTAVNPVSLDIPAVPVRINSGTAQQKKLLDSVNRAMYNRFSSHPPPVSASDKAMAAALNSLSHPRKKENADDIAKAGKEKEKDPMDVFKQQMAYMDSVRKNSDPAYIAEQKKKEASAKLEAQKASEKVLTVRKVPDSPSDFNTIKPKKSDAFMTAVIDENLTGYAGSRIRLRLLEDVMAGDVTVKSGTYLYALVNGFSGQRVTLQVKSILYENMILPVKLDLYDTDGMLGLYVPQSAFRDFTRDLGTSTVQGVTLDGSSSFVMSAASKMFESTSSAIAGVIRKNKVKLKYNSYIYLIDSEILQKTQKNL